ncbi:MAG: DUF86 domain-containing protein [Desulfoarculaceae bacterium]|nr:DUF86 domain-containing protein [Desulfoarculaceae bacterium]
MYDSELVSEILSQILEAAGRIERRFVSIAKADDFLATEAGIDKLDGICMMLITIGESLKNLDKVTGGQLFFTHPEVDWRGAKGMRDIISHHYFDLNAEVVFSVCQERLPGLVQAVTMMLDEVA